jgi:hypothetical protein
LLPPLVFYVDAAGNDGSATAATLRRQSIVSKLSLTSYV